MKKILLLIFIFSFSHNILAQLYENGYYIDNNGKLIKGLVKLLDWKKIPDQFYFKKSESAQEKKLSVKDVQEFGSDERFMIYRRFPVEIDKSSDRWDLLSFKVKPEFEKDTLFLQSLVEGAVNLYLYDNGSFRRFFYQKEGEDVPRQLIHKMYRTRIINKETDEEEDVVRTNNSYVLQLQKLMGDCTSIPRDAYQIKYERKPLMNLFIRYNKCKGNYIQTIKRYSFIDHIRLGALLGFQFSNLDFYYRKNPFTTKLNQVHFGNKLVLRFGLDIQYVMFFDKRRWSIFFEPGYSAFNDEQQDEDNNFLLEYKAVSLAGGFKRSIYLNKDNTIFIKFGRVYDLSLNSDKLRREYLDFDAKVDYDIFTSNSFLLGVGYEYKNKASLFFRYYTKSNLMKYSGLDLYRKRFELGLIYHFY